MFLQWLREAGGHETSFGVLHLLNNSIKYPLGFVDCAHERKYKNDCFTLLKHKCSTISLDAIRFFSISRVRTVWLIYGKHLTWLAIQFKSRIDEAVQSFVAISILTFASRHNVTVLTKQTLWNLQCNVYRAPT